jgi:hypothetical protein
MIFGGFKMVSIIEAAERTNVKFMNRRKDVEALAEIMSKRRERYIEKHGKQEFNKIRDVWTGVWIGLNCILEFGSYPSSSKES